MDIINTLKKLYGTNTPIFIKDIVINGVSKEMIRQALSRSKKIKRYDQGIYYFSKKL